MLSDAWCRLAQSVLAHVDLPPGRKYVALNHARGPASPRKRGPGMRNRTLIQAAYPGPAGSCPPPAAHSQQHERRDHDGHPASERETGLDAYVAQLVDEAPPLSSEQRDTLALILRRPCRR